MPVDRPETIHSSTNKLSAGRLSCGLGLRLAVHRSCGDGLQSIRGDVHCGVNLEFRACIDDVPLSGGSDIVGIIYLGLQTFVASPVCIQLGLESTCVTNVMSFIKFNTPKRVASPTSLSQSLKLTCVTRLLDSPPSSSWLHSGSPTQRGLSSADGKQTWRATKQVSYRHLHNDARVWVQAVLNPLYCHLDVLTTFLHSGEIPEDGLNRRVPSGTDDLSQPKR